MRTSEGERVDLTTPVVIGRKPTVTRLHGLEMPRLVAVPHGHVSSNHLEIRLEGWNVMAVDLHSRNGTLLRRTGEPPVRLPEQPAMLVTGDVVDLGHGVQFSFHELP
ncbi:MAG: FHA domain-containing protein [Brooklawnia sp.]|nr:FHA domain-containing protein [Brooklawnia sp.]